jgi:hypothetical protein
MFEGFLLVIFLIVIVALMNKKNLDARAPIPLDGAHHRLMVPCARRATLGLLDYY